MATASALFVDIGPTTHSINAEKEPTKATTELNSGMRIDTPTKINVTAILSMMKTCLRLRLRCLMLTFEMHVVFGS